MQRALAKFVLFCRTMTRIRCCRRWIEHHGFVCPGLAVWRIESKCFYLSDQFAFSGSIGILYAMYHTKQWLYFSIHQHRHKNGHSNEPYPICYLTSHTGREHKWVFNDRIHEYIRVNIHKWNIPLPLLPAGLMLQVFFHKKRLQKIKYSYDAVTIGIEHTLPFIRSDRALA